jgi:hypothetical protein
MPIDASARAADDSISITTATFSADGSEVLFTVRYGDVARLMLRSLPDGKSAEVAASSEWLPAMRASGSGLDWAGDGTVFGAEGRDDGVLLHLDQPAD